MESIFNQKAIINNNNALLEKEDMKSKPVSSHSCYNFCPKCGIDTTQFSHEDTCPHALTA